MTLHIEKAIPKPRAKSFVRVTDDNLHEVGDWCNGTILDERGLDRLLFINTLEGVMECKVGDIVMRGVQGEFYPIKLDIFEETYEVLV